MSQPTQDEDYQLQLYVKQSCCAYFSPTCEINGGTLYARMSKYPTKTKQDAISSTLPVSVYSFGDKVLDKKKNCVIGKLLAVVRFNENTDRHTKAVAVIDDEAKIINICDYTFTTNENFETECETLQEQLLNFCEGNGNIANKDTSQKKRKSNTTANNEDAPDEKKRKINHADIDCLRESIMQEIQSLVRQEVESSNIDQTIQRHTDNLKKFIMQDVEAMMARVLKAHEEKMRLQSELHKVQQQAALLQSRIDELDNNK